jgi:hypothetical protein
MRVSFNGNIHVFVAPMHFEPAIYDIADEISFPLTIYSLLFHYTPFQLLIARLIL